MNGMQREIEGNVFMFPMILRIRTARPERLNWLNLVIPKEKTLKRFLEYCYMIDVKVAFEDLKGEKTKGLKAALKFAKEHDMCMTEAQIQGANKM